MAALVAFVTMLALIAGSGGFFIMIWFMGLFIGAGIAVVIVMPAVVFLKRRGVLTIHAAGLMGGVLALPAGWLLSQDIALIALSGGAAAVLGWIVAYGWTTVPPAES